MIKVFFLNLLKIATIFLLMICAVGFSIEENLSSTARLILSPLFSVLLIFFFHKWIIKPLLLKAKSAKETRQSPGRNADYSESSAVPLASNVAPAPESKLFNSNPVVVWSGTTKPVSFRLFSDKERREGVFTQLEIHKDGDFYFFSG